MHKIRATIFNILEADIYGSLSAKVVNLSLISLIVINIVAIILETVESIGTNYADLFFAIEVFSVFVFAIEYVLRLWCCVEAPTPALTSHVRKRFHKFFQFSSLIDLLAFLPSLLSIFFSLDLRFLRVLRLLRVFKLTRYSVAMNTVLDVLKKESSAFFAAFFILLVILIIAASGIYLVEHDVQPEAFASIPSAMWWAVATLTTVGYGDVTPITSLGKLFGACITIVGVGMVALPAGILASSFADHLHHRRGKMQTQIADALADGHISDTEQISLSKLAMELGMTNEELTQEIRKYSTSNNTKQPTTCPHCGESIR